MGVRVLEYHRGALQVLFLYLTTGTLVLDDKVNLHVKITEILPIASKKACQQGMYILICNALA